MIRIGNYGIDADNLNFILLEYGMKEKRLAEGETPREVVKTTSYFSNFKDLYKAMVNNEIRVNIQSGTSVEKAYFDAYDGLTQLVAETCKKFKGGKL